jgi:hypothetical protein
MTAEEILYRYEEKIATPGLTLREFLFSELKDINKEAVATLNIILNNKLTKFIIGRTRTQRLSWIQEKLTIRGHHSMTQTIIRQETWRGRPCGYY